MIFDELRIGNSWNDIISASTVLPVSLIDLKLTTNKNISTLSWTSKTENNFSKYDVMFSSNGNDFKEVGSVLGRGNNSTYSFSHSHMGEGFFKLMMVDVDGRFSYSRVLRANAKSISVRVGPNPVSDRLYINGMPEGTNNIVLYNLSGSSVRSQVIRDANLTMSMSGLPAGAYVLKITSNGEDVFTSTIII
jgi:hypothetical protein